MFHCQAFYDNSFKWIQHFQICQNATVKQLLWEIKSCQNITKGSEMSVQEFGLEIKVFESDKKQE